MPGWMKWAIALLIGFAIIVLGWRLSDSRWFSWVLPTFFVINCLVLVIVVLLQSGKAADLAGAFGGAGSQTAFGPRGAATILSRATTWCAIMFMICAMALVLHTEKGLESGGSVLQDVSRPAPKKAPVTPPAQQTPAPAMPAPQAPASQSTTPQNPPSKTATPGGAPQTNNAPPSQQPASQQPAAQKPVGQAPATSQPAPPQPATTPPKKP